MRSKAHGREHACDCAAHRTPTSNAGAWSAVLPILACAVCPACLTTYAKLFSVLGIGFGLSELHHQIILAVAILSSISLSAWRSWRSKRVWPIAIALFGSSLVLFGHIGGELHFLEWTGVVVLLVGGLSEHFRLRRMAARRHLTHA